MLNAKNDTDLRQIMQKVLKAKKVVVISGAGISVAAGLLAFRGAEGLYHAKELQHCYGYKGNIEDLFSVSILRNNNTKGIHAQVVANLAKLSILASPTKFHYMLQDLNRKKTLLRCYSQNIDGLESKVGFNMDSTLDLSNRCIPLHGSLHFLRCIVCASTHLLQNYHAILASGHFPLCSLCQQKQYQRSAASHRPRQIGQLRPDIVLYGEDHPQGEAIAAAYKHDLTLDLLVVVGTSLKIPGTASLIKKFSKQLHDNDLPHSFYINETAPSKEWHNIFDVFVEGDCQVFAKTLRSSMGTLSLVPNPHKRENNWSVAAYLENLEARQDFRPTWRWI